MEIEIFWSRLAENKLQDIFDYYKVKAGTKIAKKIVSQIFNKTEYLHENPKIGPIEELLKDRKQEFRYLIITNYKIIYYINQNRIMVANVFDTRQDPTKIQETY